MSRVKCVCSFPIHYLESTWVIEGPPQSEIVFEAYHVTLCEFGLMSRIHKHTSKLSADALGLAAILWNVRVIVSYCCCSSSGAEMVCVIKERFTPKKSALLPDVR